MKNLIAVFVLLLIFTSCEKVEDDTGNFCTSNCTTLRGKFVTLNDQPVPNIRVALKYRISGGELGGGYTRKIVNTKSDKNGNFNNFFFIKDSELGRYTGGYFEVDIDDSNLDNNKYIRTNNLIGNTTSDIGFAIYSIINRDTIIDETYYIPKKAYIKVNLNNYAAQKEGDRFEVRTYYPFGPKVGQNTFLNSEYATGFSGYDNWTAKTLNNSFKVFVAEGEKNIIHIIKLKNGVLLNQDIEVFVPANNTIELTYDY